MIPGELLFFNSGQYSWFRLYVAVVGETVTYVDYDEHKTLTIDTSSCSSLEFTEKAWREWGNSYVTRIE